MDFEVVVIGGGPAGTQCALDLACAGTSVVVLEQRPLQDSTYVPCLIGPKLEATFGDYPNNIIEGECALYRIIASKEYVEVPASVTNPPQPHLGHFANKYALIAHDRECASDAGAVYHYETKVTRVNFSADHIEVETSNPDIPRVTGEVAVLAPGVHRFSNSFLTQLQLPVPKTVQVVWRTYNLSPDVALEQPCHFGLIWNQKISQHSYIAYYNYPTGFFIGLLDFGRTLAEMTNILRDVCERHKLVAPLLAGATQTLIISEDEEYECPREIISPTYKDRLLILGDAAGFVNTFVREGIFQAKISGQCAAETILEARQTGHYHSANLSGYERRWKEKLDEANLRPGRASAYLFYDTGKLDTVANALVTALKREQAAGKSRFQNLYLSSMIAPTYSRANDVEWTKALLGAMPLADKAVMTPRFLKAAFVK